MEWVLESCKDFSEALASSSPTPGGGGAAAMVGAIGSALGSMVANLTIGRKNYAEVEESMQELLDQTEKFRVQLLDLVKKDADGFNALMDIYRMPHTSDEEKTIRVEKLQEATKNACSAPLEIMEICASILTLLERIGVHGNINAISDAACGAIFCKAAIEAASFSVEINLKNITDEVYTLKTQSYLQDTIYNATIKTDEILKTTREKW